MFNPSFPRNARLDPSLPGTGSKLRIEIYSHGRILLEFSTPCKWEFSFPGSEKAPNTPPITKTMMSPLPPEMLDLIVDFLHDEPDALKACCLTSKSWVHRTRQHLFAHLEFFSKHHAKTWKEIFSDPSDSPAHYARSLSIHMSRVVTSVSGSVGGWIRTFSGVIRLHVDIHGYGSSKAEISLVPLRGFSPTLKSLRLACGCSVPSSEIFGLVCSFPLLEDLTLLSLSNNSELDRWNIPSTSPKFTGCLDLKMLDGIRPAVRRLLEIPRGLHFSKISVSCPKEDVESMMDLVSECSDTLESLDIYYYPTAERSTPSLDLSKLTKLKDVAFGSHGSDVQWITTTLQSAESINLQKIVIHSPNAFRKPIVESAYQEWQDLDRLLLQLWTSRSIRPKIGFNGGAEGRNLRHLVPRLFPELTGRGIVDPVECD